MGLQEMASRLIQVSFRWPKALPDEQQLKAAISSVCIDWCRLNIYCWYLWTDLNPTEVYAGLSRIVTNDDGIVAVAVDPSMQPFGWAPQFVWDWLNPKVVAQRPKGLINQ
jgi:hypothetical protein